MRFSELLSNIQHAADETLFGEGLPADDASKQQRFNFPFQQLCLLTQSNVYSA
jgi:hypothetical protein